METKRYFLKALEGLAALLSVYYISTLECLQRYELEVLCYAVVTTLINDKEVYTEIYIGVFTVNEN